MILTGLIYKVSVKIIKYYLKQCLLLNKNVLIIGKF
jgi:hypothetical protein